jgi:uncharacterized protein HemX
MHKTNQRDIVIYLISGFLIGALIVLIMQPVRDVTPYKDREKELIRQADRLRQQIDSLNGEYDLFVNNYKRLYRSLEIQKEETNKLQKEYDLLKRRKPRNYTDAEIDSILAARYGRPILSN